MRYPVSNTGSKVEFNKDWYVAQAFGNKTDYGYHEGVDINTRTGGDTDLGKEIKAISSGPIEYYHYGSHPTKGFGRHLVYRIDGPWGTRWVMCSHMTETGSFSQQQVSEGQVIGYVGKSGTPVAHLHFSIFKKDPVNLRNGIDTIAKTVEELNEAWEDPMAFIETWSKKPVEPAKPIITDQTLIPLGGQYGNVEVQAIRSMLADRDRQISTLAAQLNDSVSKIQSIRKIVA